MKIERQTIQKIITEKAEAFKLFYDDIDSIIDSSKKESADIPIWRLEELLNLYSEIYEKNK